MANSWCTYEVFSTDDGLFRLSLQSPIEETDSYFLDLRRCFSKDGKFLCTKRGIRINTSTVLVTELVEGLQTIVQGKEKRWEGAGLCLIRRVNNLHICKMDGKVSVPLSSSEAVFLLTKLIVLKNFIAKRDDDDSDDEMEQWV